MIARHDHVATDPRTLRTEVPQHDGELVVRTLVDAVDVGDRDLRGRRSLHRDRDREGLARRPGDRAPVDRRDRALHRGGDVRQRGLGLSVVRHRDRHRYGRRRVRIELYRVVAERDPRRGRGAEVPRRVSRGEPDREPQVRGLVRHDDVVLLGPARVEGHRESGPGDLREDDTDRVGGDRAFRRRGTGGGRDSGRVGNRGDGARRHDEHSYDAHEERDRSLHIRCPGRRYSEHRPPRAHRLRSPVVDGPGAPAAAPHHDRGDEQHHEERDRRDQ